MEFEGEFETHFTIAAGDPARIEAARAWAASNRLKFLQIVLDQGFTPNQPMITRRATGLLSEQLAAAAGLAGQLAGLGLGVVRIKVEAAPENRDVPPTDAEAATGHAGRYFEHHVKLALDPGADMAALTTVARRHDAHLSRNARRERDDGRRERFLTQRCFGVGRETAHSRLNAVLAALVSDGYSVLDVEQEFVVHDSNFDLDAGWIGGPGRGAAPPLGPTVRPVT